MPAYSENLNSNKKYKVGYIAEYLESDEIQKEVKETTLRAIDDLQKMRHSVEKVHFSLLDYCLPTYYLLTTAEASTNLSRYDGVRYGYRSQNTHNLESMYKMTRSEGFGEEVKTRIILGSFVLSSSYYDAYFTKAQKVRRLIRDKTKQLLSEYDFLISPVAPTTAMKINDMKALSPVQMYLADLFTTQASISGIPAISIPYGEDEKGLPIGLQIMANSFGEEKILDLASQFTK